MSILLEKQQILAMMTSQWSSPGVCVHLTGEAGHNEVERAAAGGVEVGGDGWHGSTAVGLSGGC